MDGIFFRHWMARVDYPGRYPNGRLAITLTDYMTEERIAVATVNVPEVELGADQVIIKSYSENEGMVDVLERAGIVKRTGAEVQIGFVTAPVCQLIDPEAPAAIDPGFATE